MINSKERLELVNIQWRLFLFSDRKEKIDHAFASIYSCCINELFAYGVSLGLDEATVEDFIHDIFVDIYTKREKLKNITNFSPYLFRSIRNRTLNYFRKNSMLSDEAFTQIPFPTTVTVLDSLINEEEKKEIKGIVEELLNNLTDRQREAIYLRYMLEMEYEEIAHMLDMKIESVRKLIYRSISILRKKSRNMENPHVLVMLLAILAKRL